MYIDKDLGAIREHVKSAQESEAHEVWMRFVEIIVFREKPTLSRKRRDRKNLLTIFKPENQHEIATVLKIFI